MICKSLQDLAPDLSPAILTSVLLSRQVPLIPTQGALHILFPLRAMIFTLILFFGSLLKYHFFGRPSNGSPWFILLAPHSSPLYHWPLFAIMYLFGCLCCKYPNTRQTGVSSTLWSQHLFMLLKIINDPKELLFIWVISINIYSIRN